MSDGGKGSKQRPGNGYSEGWDAIFGKKQERPTLTNNKPKFKVGQSVVFKLDDERHDLDYLRDYTVTEIAIEKSPFGKCLISLAGEFGFYDQNDFEDFDEWASHQKKCSDEHLKVLGL